MGASLSLLAPAEAAARYARRMGFLSPVTEHGILRRLQSIRRAAVHDILAARKSGLPCHRTMASVLRPLPRGRLVLDATPRLSEALASFRFAALPLTDMAMELAGYAVTDAPCALCRELGRACLSHRTASDWPRAVRS